MSPGRDNIADIDARRREKPARLSFEIGQRDGSKDGYSLEWPRDGSRMWDAQSNLVIPRLLAAGLSFNGSPLNRQVLE